MAKFGAAYGVRTGIHVGVDVLINRMGKAPTRAQIHHLRHGARGALFTGIMATRAPPSSGTTARTMPFLEPVGSERG